MLDSITEMTFFSWPRDCSFVHILTLFPCTTLYTIYLDRHWRFLFFFFLFSPLGSQRLIHVYVLRKLLSPGDLWLLKGLVRTYLPPRVKWKRRTFLGEENVCFTQTLCLAQKVSNRHFIGDGEGFIAHRVFVYRYWI